MSNTLELQNELSRVTTKLLDLRKRWAVASPALKKCLEVIGKLEKEKKVILEKKLESLKTPPQLF